VSSRASAAKPCCANTRGLGEGAQPHGLSCSGVAQTMHGGLHPTCPRH
jgi:hypothetical protein